MSQEILSTQVKGRIVAYDLPCGKRIAFTENGEESPQEKKTKREAQRKVEASRVASTNLLYSLGLGCTQSVILCPSRTTKEQIDQVIGKVRQLYEKTNGELVNELGLREIGDPDIRTIPIVETQFVTLKDLTEKRLSESLDAAISEMAKAVKTLSALGPDDKQKRNAYLKQREKKIQKTQELAKSLSIDLDEKFGLLGELLKTAIRKTEV